jgi:beta-lactamase regulating signal transducer with metallopeptidase domain
MGATSLMLSTYVLNALWQIPLIALTAWICIKLANRLPAKYHHAVWVAALLLSVVLPLTSLPKPRGPGGPDKSASIHYAGNDSYDPLLLNNPRGTFLRGLHGHSRKVSLAPILKWALVALYIAYFVYRLFRLAWAWRRTVQLAESVTDTDLPEAAREIADRLARQCSLRGVAIRSSRETASPFISGIRRPVLVMPESILRQTPKDDLSSILAHEFAHVKRHDFPLNLLYEILQLPVAFHPVTSVLKGRIDRSRELACDEMAAEETSSRRGYARSLLRIAQSISMESVQRQSNHALGLFYTDNLEERIMSLLAIKNGIGKRWGQLVLGAVAAIFVVACFGISAYTLQVSAATTETYSGRWLAEYQGKNFLVISLNEEKENLSGSIRMMNTQINLEGDGEVYQISGKLSEPTNLTKIRPDGKAIRFDFLEEGDTEPVHWRMELTSPNDATLTWIELPKGLRFKPIRLTRDTAGTSVEAYPPTATSMVQRGTESTGNPIMGFVLGDLKIEGDVHDREAVTDRVLNAWKDRVFDNSKELVESVSETGVRGDFQERGYFKVVVHDAVVKPLNVTGEKQRILIITPVTEGDQFRLKSLTIQNEPPDRGLSIPAVTIREQFHIRDGDLLNVAEIRAGMDRVVKLYKDRGYPDVAPKPDTSIDSSTHRITLVLHITEGPRKS